MADEETRTLLQSWGINEAIVEKFKDNDIDYRALKELKEDEVAELFDTLGQRLRFRAGLKTLHPILQPVVLGVGPDTPSGHSVSDVDLLSLGSHSPYDLSSTSTFASIPEEPSITPVKHIASTSIIFETQPVAQSTPVKQIVSSASPCIKAKLLNASSEEPKVKRAKCITSYNLKEILNERIAGKLILNYYDKYGKLNHINQVNLAKYLIDVEWNNSLSNKIETSRFFELRDTIKELFPAEDPDLYYVPYKNLKNGKKLSARGKLYDQYHELRRTLIQSGLLRSNKTKQALHFTTDEGNSQVDDDATNEQYEWLTKSSQPLKQVEIYWKETYKRRIKEFEKHNSITIYVSTFPILKENCGYSFLVSDFAEKFCDSKDTFIASWPLFKDKLISYVVKTRTSNFLESLQVFSIDIDNNGELESTVAALRLLALLLPVTRGIKTPNKNVYKPSKLEVVDSMILMVKSDGDFKNAVSERKAHYARMKLPCQPITVIVFKGQKVSKCYVIIEEIEYLVTSPMLAFDVCFKCLFSLNAQYPVESKLAWLYIQKYIYGIETPYDGSYAAVKNLFSALK